MLYKRSKNIEQPVTALLFLVVVLTSFGLSAYGNRFSLFDNIKEPTLLYPITEDIDLTGKDALEFRWIQTPGMFVYYAEFKLYNGANNYGSDLIYKEKIQPGNYPFKVSANYFEQGKTYSWTLKLVLTNGNRTDIAYSTFKVIKK